jgi:ABC-type sugar transport system ATPase subunit/ribose/xylose/arabinose/galactoside ABC-type transport system permease subunit
MIDSIRPAATTVVQLRDLCKSFPGVKALEDVSMDLHAGTIHALVGENGAGKSTLINILCGVLQPDRGEVRVNGLRIVLADARQARRQGIAAVHQEADLFPDMTVAENVALEHGWPRQGPLIAWSRLKNDTRSAIGALGHNLEPGRLAASLSSADRQLVGIAAALSQAASAVILDEPTSSLSEAETEILFRRLRHFRSQGGAVLYVSHRLEEIFQLADVATVLRDGRRVWNGPVAATDPSRLIAWMVGREIESASRLRAPRPPSVSAHPVRLACRQLTALDGSFANVTLEVRAGEVLGLYGLIGAGRSGWAQAVFGLRAIATGSIFLDGKPWKPRGVGAATRRGLAYLPEDRLRFGLCSGLSVRANAVLAVLRRLARGPFISRHKETRQAWTMVEQLAVRLRALEQPAGTLSGGNQQKIIFGRWLACDPQTLILDEPTRGVDVAAKAEIQRLVRGLADTGRAVVWISSDLPEVLAQSDRIGVFRDGNLVATFDPDTTTAEQVAAAALQQKQPQTQRPDRPAPQSRWTSALALGSREVGLLGIVILLMALLAWRTETFWQPGALRDLADNASLLSLCGLGAGLVILTGGIDISFGSIMALGAATAGFLMQAGWSALVAVPAGLGVATAAGATNAAVTLVGRVHPIVVTLGTMSLYRGLTLLIIGNEDIRVVPSGFRAPIQAVVLGVPAIVWLGLAAAALAWFLLSWTVPGREAVAFGSNPRAAERTGIRRARVWLAVFTLEGLLAGVAGLISLGMTGNLQGTDHDEKTLEAIGVAVVGGVAITGGRGSVWGIWAAALLFRVLEKGWVHLHVSSYWQRSIVGALLVIAILGDRLWRHYQHDPETS